MKRALLLSGVAVIVAVILALAGCASGKRAATAEPTPYATTMINSDGTSVRCVVFGDKIDCDWKDPE